MLLQNKGATLPFKLPPSGGEVLVIGGSANSTRLLGSGHYARNLALVDGWQTGGFPGIPQAIAALLTQKHQQQKKHKSAAEQDDDDAAADESARVRYLPGIKCSHRSDAVCVDPSADAGLLTAAASAAKTASQVVLVLNLQSRSPCDSAAAVRAGGEQNPCGYESEQHDRPNIALPKHQVSKRFQTPLPVRIHIYCMCMAYLTGRGVSGNADIS